MKRQTVSGVGALVVTGLLLGPNAEAHDVPAAPEPVSLDGIAAAFQWDWEAPLRVEKVTDSLHVIFGVGGNIGVLTGDDGAFLVDDQFPRIMDRIRKEVGRLGSKEIRFAVNTHWHFDHADGNLALGPAGTTIVSQANSREMMKSDHFINLAVLAYEQKAYPEEALPVVTYDDTMQLHLNGERIDLWHFGPAHTTGDTAVYFAGSNAVHMGDVFVKGMYPFIDAGNGGTLDGVIAFCKEVLARIDEETVVIPGHGPIATHQDLVGYVSMLETVRERMLEHIAKGATFEEIATAGLTKDWDEALGDNTMFLNRAYVSLTHRHVPDSRQ